MKKLFISTITCSLLLASTAIPALASPNPTNANNDNFSIVDVAQINDGSGKASWGQGVLHAKNPWGSKPSAYAVTETYGGTAYKLEAQTLVDNNGISFDKTKVSEAWNQPSVQSSTLGAKTEKCKFTGDHWIKDTSTSGWQSATTSKTYN